MAHPSMTKSHFKLIAECVKDMRFADEGLKAYVAENLASCLSRTNHAFKRDTFLEACGVKE